MATRRRRRRGFFVIRTSMVLLADPSSGLGASRGADNISVLASSVQRVQCADHPRLLLLHRVSPICWIFDSNTSWQAVGKAQGGCLLLRAHCLLRERSTRSRFVESRYVLDLAETVLGGCARFLHRRNGHSRPQCGRELVGMRKTLANWKVGRHPRLI